MSDTPFQPPSPEKQALASFSKDIGYEIPIETVPLPSKGVVYDAEHPLFNESGIDVKAMTAKEEDLLTSSALIKNGTVISRLIQSCLLNKTVDPDSLLTGDRNALLIAIRITGYGAEYSAKIQCPECDEQFEYEFTLQGLKITNLGADPLEANRNLFGFDLPSKRTVHFRLLTGWDEAELSVQKTRRKKLGDKSDKDVTSRLLRAVVSIGGETDPSKVAKMVLNMPARDARALRKYIAKISPDVDMKQFATCSFCNEESEVNIPLGVSFFWPDVE